MGFKTRAIENLNSLKNTKHFPAKSLKPWKHVHFPSGNVVSAVACLTSSNKCYRMQLSHAECWCQARGLLYLQSRTSASVPRFCPQTLQISHFLSVFPGLFCELDGSSRPLIPMNRAITRTMTRNVGKAKAVSSSQTTFHGWKNSSGSHRQKVESRNISRQRGSGGRQLV